MSYSGSAMTWLNRARDGAGKGRQEQIQDLDYLVPIEKTPRIDQDNPLRVLLAQYGVSASKKLDGQGDECLVHLIRKVTSDSSH